MGGRSIAVDAAPGVYAATNHVVSEVVTRSITEMGTKRAASVFVDSYLRQVASRATEGGVQVVTGAVVAASKQAAAVRATANFLAPIGGKLAGGAIAGPAVEVVLLLRDGGHTMDEYVEAAARGAVSGVAGAAAGAAASAAVTGMAAVITGAAVGAAAGSVVPVVGTAVGLFVGAFASAVVNRQLKA